jgi:hypothetical protein
MNRIAGIVACLVLAAVAVFLTARPHPASADDWLPIDPADLAMKDNPKQPGADAMLLYREVTVDAKPSTVDNYMRIKVLTSAGVKQQSDIQIQYDKQQESILSVRARTIRPDGSIVAFEGKPFDKEVIKGNGIKFLAKSFTMPDVQPGSIIEYRYREQYDEYRYVNFYWVIQSDLFTRLAKFAIKWDDTPGAPGFAFRTYAMPNSLLPQKEKDRYVLEVHDLAGVQEETLMPPPISLKAAVDFYYHDDNAPAKESVADFWKRTGKGWNELLERFIDKKKELAEEVSRDVNPSDPPEVKLRKLYARALKVRNLDMEDDKTRKEERAQKLKDNNNVDDVLKRNYGNSVEINFLMIGLARAAGFEATDVRVSGRNSRDFLPQREASYDMTTELVWVRAAGKEYYLDPGVRYYPFGVLPWYESAANGFRVGKDNSELIRTTRPVSSDAIIARHVDVALDNDLEMSGKIEVEYRGLEAASRRYDYRDEDEAGRKKMLRDQIKAWLPLESTFEVTSIGNWDDVEAPLQVEGTFKSPAGAPGAVSRMTMPMEMFQSTEVGYFQSQDRQYEIDFAYPYQVTDDIVVRLPLGYKPLAIPDPQKVNPGPVSYEISAAAQDDHVEVKRQLTVEGIRYPKTSYPALRSFFSNVKTDDTSPLMLQASR